MRARIEPREPPAHLLYLKVAALQIRAVHIRDLKFAAYRRPDRLRDFNDIVVVEVQPRHRIVRARRLGLLLQTDSASRLIKLHDAVALRIAHVVGEHRRTRLACRRTLQKPCKIGAVKDVVAQHERTTVAADEILADEERLRQTVGARLHSIRDMNAPLAAVTEHGGKHRAVLRRRDDEDVL